MDLDRAAFFGKYLHWKPEVAAVTLPDGGRCHVRVMSGTDLDSWQGENLKVIDGEVKAGGNQRSRLVVRCACNAEGVRLFRDEEAENVGGFPGPVLDAIYQAARKLNQLDGNPEQDAKNLPSGRTASSGSGSPEVSAALAAKPNSGSMP